MMKHHDKILAALAALCFAAGAAQAASDSDSASGQADDKSMKEQWSETMESLGAYTSEQRDKALEAGRRTLDAMDERIERMEAWTSEHWDSLSAEAREEKTRMLNAMREQRKKVAEWYGGMKHGSAETWDNVKQGFIRSYDKLQNVYDDTADSFTSEDETESTESEQ